MSTTPELAELARRLASEGATHTEADIRGWVATFLDRGDFDLDETDVHLESPSGDGGRIDVEMGQTVIEVKRRIDVTRVAEAAEDQLARYLRSRETETGESYSGVLTDGRIWRLYRLASGGELRRVSEHLNHGNADALSVWLEGALATRHNIRPTPENIEALLGVKSTSYALEMDRLREIYQRNREDSRLHVKMRLWERSLGIALGLGFADLETTDKEDLFVRHSYLVLIAEIIAHLVIGVDVTTADPALLTSGAIFRQLEIDGVVEADFFDWMAEVQGGSEFIRRLGRRLSRFDFREPRHDVLKVLYESIIDQRTRHSLGEYYTPDWLASQMVREVVDDPLAQTVLDPACGSGTFLFWAVKAGLEAAFAARMSTPDAIRHVTSRVFGIDLHPVAVALARVTVLLAIGQDYLMERERFGVQVFLGDSMMWHQSENIFGQDAIAVDTAGAGQLFGDVMRFPIGLLEDLEGFDQLVSDMTVYATDREPRATPRPVEALLRRVPPEFRSDLEHSYSVLCMLHDENANHIWGYYIRNTARPFAVALRKVDRLIGNPPWLSYRHMDPGIQKRFRDGSKARGLWAGGKFATHQDLSAFFVARCVERFLKPSGRFGFVLPAGALKSIEYEGFRTGNWSGVDVGVTAVNMTWKPAWRLVDVKPDPFPVPSCVVFGEKTLEKSTPLSAEVDNWSARLPSRRNLDWDSVARLVSRSPRRVRVATGEGDSYYRSEFTQGATLTPRRFLIVETDTDQPSIGAGRGRRFVRSRTSSLDRPPWSSIEPLRGAIEDRFLRPAFLGESVLPFRVTEPLTAVVPYDGAVLMNQDSPLLDLYPGLAEWWRAVSRLWTAHRAPLSPETLLDRVDYHSGLSRQLTVRGARVVYTTSGSILSAAMVTDPDAVIDTSLYWARVHSASEGNFLMAVLNSEAVLEQVAEYQPIGAFGRRHFHKHVFEVPIPQYDERQESHRALAELGQRATEAAETVDITGMNFITARKRIRQALKKTGLHGQIEDLVEGLF